MAAYVYVLGSDNPRRSYVGWTTDLDQRLARHNAGTGAKSTRGRVWFLLYAERYPTRTEAMSREWHLKRDRVFRKALLGEDVPQTVIPGAALGAKRKARRPGTHFDTRQISK